MQERVKALGLFSGGLDSMLACRVLQEQGIEVVAYKFVSPFFDAGAAPRSARQLGIRLELVDVTDSYLEVLRKPRYGYGRNLNPCVDCHAFMFRLLGQRLEAEGARFLFSGEVLGQRPFSQNRSALRAVARLSGFEGRIVRPLSARLLEETEPERAGWVDRRRLLNIQGRSRRRQMELAAFYGLKDFPSPAGGCLLTDLHFSRRLRDLLDHVPDPRPSELELLKIGRHLRVSPHAKVVVGRREEENKRIAALMAPGDVLLEVRGVPGPTALWTGRGDPPWEEIEFAARVAVRYSDAPPGTRCEVAWIGAGREGGTVRVEACEEEEIRRRMVGFGKSAQSSG